VRARVAILISVLGLAGAVAVVAAAQSGSGLPAYTNGYQKWPKLNRAPVTAPGAHNGIKNVFASKRKAGKAYPNGTVIVKSIAQRGDPPARPTQVAVMRKVKGRWQWVEYERSGARYGVLAKGQLCISCHMQARANDWVFTTR
jgi:hypothetical protein